jgi:SH3-like domain-containing protein|tara:strand:+ start:116 stop:556 length:441 start_codon:yes stop_codon:yes gene_type:complete
MYKKVILLFFYLTNFVLASEEYFLTLRNDTVNLRQGPSFEYPIKIFYKKKYLPVLIQDKSGNFKKIRDHENNSGWIHVSQLSKKNAAITVDKNVMVFKNPTLYSKPLLILEKGKLCLVVKCKNEWCKIKVERYSGWIKKESLWGRY